MNNAKIAKRTGITLAMAAAGMLSACASNSENSVAASGSGTAAAGATDLVHCYGVNVCKGHNDCKTAKNACGGHGSCKGQGFIAMPGKACKDVGGSIRDSWRGQISKADLVHCYGVNVCKGHNDCKTAENACAGRGSCKGHGFVATTAKACKDMSGKAGP